MKPMLTKPRTYYISSLRLRRELIPLPDLLAYRCVTWGADGPHDGDVILPDQVAMEDALIELGVYKPRGWLRSPIRTAYAAVWRGLHLDQIMPEQKPRQSPPPETLLYQYDSPYRPKGA